MIDAILQRWEIRIGLACARLALHIDEAVGLFGRFNLIGQHLELHIAAHPHAVRNKPVFNRVALLPHQNDILKALRFAEGDKPLITDFCHSRFIRHQDKTRIRQTFFHLRHAVHIGGIVAAGFQRRRHAAGDVFAFQIWVMGGKINFNDIAAGIDITQRHLLAALNSGVTVAQITDQIHSVTPPFRQIQA